MFGRCFADGVPEEKEWLRPVILRVFLEEEEEEGPALRFASRFMKVLNLRGLWCDRSWVAAPFEPAERTVSAATAIKSLTTEIERTRRIRSCSDARNVGSHW
jgi:hypothetical protein